MNSDAKSLDILASLSVLNNYFYDLTKLFLNLYLVKFLVILAKTVFPCTSVNSIVTHFTVKFVSIE